MHGLYLLWWVEEKQLSPAVVATVLAAGDLALMGLELPTGWFADRYGHRASLIVGSFVQTIGMLWCWLGHGVSGLITASVLVALGDGFRSGAHQALLYRTCRALDRADDFQRIEARTEAVTQGTLVVLVLLGGIIVQTGGFAIGWLAETVLSLLGLAIACLMVEPPPDRTPTESEAASAEAAPVCYRTLALAIAPAALLGGAAAAASFLAQTTRVNGVVSVTMLVAALTAAEAGGHTLASRLPPANPIHQIQLAAGGSILVVIVMAITGSLPLVALMLAGLAGVVQPLRAALIQRLAADTIRARAASAASACDMAISTIALPLAGLWRNRRH